MVMIIDTTWTDIKSVMSNKALRLQYHTLIGKYLVWLAEGNVIYRAYITKAATAPDPSDQKDFEDNYKDDANKPVFVGDDTIFEDEAIRDTSNHTSTVSDNRGAIPKTICIDNDLNQTVTVQLQGAIDSAFTHSFNIGNSFDISATTHDYATISDYMPYLRAVVSCSTAPTTGDLTIHLLRVRT